MSFFEELKRRNVVRMGVLYVVASWVFLQIADVVFDPLGVPDWAFRLVLGLLALGFPFTLIISWVFELTPEGLKRESDIDRSQSLVQQTGNRMNMVIVVLLVLAIGGLVVDRMIPETSTPANTVDVSAETGEAQSTTPAVEDARDEKTIAVLPFLNMSGDPDNEYFSDGLTEELLNTLVRMGGLKVTGRTSSFAFKGRNQDLREIGQLLDVAHVLEGSVRKAGNQVRITAQLIKTSDGYHLWSDTFDRELDDIFSIQAEIAQQVTSALQVTLLGGDQSSRSELVDEPVISSAGRNAKAYEEYLRGMYIWQRAPDNREALEKARGHFERALEIDDGYIDAYWGMYLYWDRMNRNGHVAFTESLEQMSFYAVELERRAPGSDRALIATAQNARTNYEYEKSENYLEEAVRRFPASAVSLGAYSTVLQARGEYDKASEAVNKAMELDPLSLEVMRSKASISLRTGDCEALEQTMNRALEIDPNIGRFRAYLAFCIFSEEGDAAKAMPYAEAEPLGFLRETAQAIFYHKLDEPEKAQQQLDKMFAAYGDAASYQYGQIYAQWDEKDLAMAWLENAVTIRDTGIILAGGDALLDPLRNEPRFQKILESAGHH